MKFILISLLALDYRVQAFLIVVIIFNLRLRNGIPCHLSCINYIHNAFR